MLAHDKEYPVEMLKKIRNHPSFISLKEKLDVFRQSERGKLTFKVLRYTFQFGILGYLIYQLTHIGWMNVIRALPLNPLFYILLLVHYFVLPISEQYIYRLSLNFSFWQGVKIFVKKKILNTDVYVYSGEAYFFWWARQNLKETDRYIFNVIKDNNIISSIASTFMAVIVLLCFLFFSQETMADIIPLSENAFKWTIIGAVIALPLIIYLLRFIISMTPIMAGKVFTVHTIRFVLAYALEICQWAVVLPEVPLHYWFIYSGSKMVMSRFPIPSVDLLFIPVSISISERLGGPDAEIAALMIAVPAVNKAVNFIFYSLLAIFDKNHKTEMEKSISEIKNPDNRG